MQAAPGLLWLLAACMMLACVSGCGEKYVKDGFGDTLVFGKITVVAEDGTDMTKYCKFRISEIDDISRAFEKSGRLSQDRLAARELLNHRKAGRRRELSEAGTAISDLYFHAVRADEIEFLFEGDVPGHVHSQRYHGPHPTDRSCSLFRRHRHHPEA